MREADVAWAAGLFEGEGCFRAVKRNGVFMRPTMGLEMTDVDVVHRFHMIVGVGSVTVRDKSDGRKRTWAWQSGAIDDVRHVIRLFAPWLGERRSARAQELLLQYEAASVRRVSKTHCPNGHEFTAENTVAKAGGRRCLKCRRTQGLEAQRRYEKRKKEVALYARDQ